MESSGSNMGSSGSNKGSSGRNMGSSGSNKGNRVSNKGNTMDSSVKTTGSGNIKDVGFGGLVTDGHLLLSKFSKKPRKAMVIDIRSNEEFRQGHVPYSLNIPHSSAFLPDGSLSSNAASASLSNNRGRFMAVVGNKGESAPIVSSMEGRWSLVL